MQRHVLKWYKTTYVLLVFTNFLYSYTWSSWAKSQRRQIYQNNNLIYDSLLPLMAMRHETYNTLLHCSIYKSGDTFLDTSLDWVARGFLPLPKIWNLVPANNGEKNYTPAVPKEMSVSETCSWRPLNSREVIVLWVCLFVLGLSIFWNYNTYSYPEKTVHST